MKVVILCGGSGTRLREETESKPKPMVEIGGKPILWHIMKAYAHFGYNDFVLCLGYKGEMIKNYFLNNQNHDSDLSTGPATVEVQPHGPSNAPAWLVTPVDTGLNAMTGARVKRVEQHIDGDSFMLTYGDGLSNLDIENLAEFHMSHDKIGTVTAVSPPSTFGELKIEGDQVVQFNEKPESRETLINGGFFVFRREFFEYLSEDDSCILERVPLERLAADGQLAAHKHAGYWRCMDTYKDMLDLNEQWEGGNAGWKVWV